MRWRIGVSAAIGFASGAFCWFLMKRLHQDAADFHWALHLVHRLLARQNPYDTPLEQYPLTAGLFALPFVPLRPDLAAGLFWGISSSALAFGLTRHGYTRLLIFFAYPYWAGLLAVQWSPIIAASGFFPLLLPATMAKPQVGLPVFLTRLSRLGLLACAVVGLVSLAVMPQWPVLWFRQIQNYEHFIPILVLPGPLLLLALLRCRNRDAQLLFLSTLMPQRWFFDSFILWLIPQSRREIIWTVFFSWGAGIWRWYHMPSSFTEVGRSTVIFLYLPMLAVVLLRKGQNNVATANASSHLTSV
ncbi:MAG: hypothetical protein ABR881_03610 [Candidatus Sulfotelmatobacter sp.]|jgi:hypothetical protein